MEVVSPPRVTDPNYTYVRVVRDSKWQSKKLRDADNTNKDTGLLKKCLSGRTTGREE